MSGSVLTAILAVAAVALLGLLMRRFSSAVEAAVPPPAPRPPEPLEDEPAGDEDESFEAAAVTSDGWAFVPVGDRDRVRLVPPRASDPMDPVAVRAPEQLQRGDLLAARVARGAPDHDPWRLEALGRDREFRAWRFETEDAARAALALVERCIVRPPRDEEGGELAVGDADFAEARRLEEEIERELATMPDLESGAEDPARRPIG